MAGSPWNEQHSRETPIGDEVRVSSRPFHEHAVLERSTDDQVDVVALWQSIRDEWRFILLVAAGVLSTVVALTLLMRMDFLSSGRLYLGELDEKGRSSASSEIDISGGGPGDVSSEMEILKSRAIVKDGVLDSGLNASIVPTGWVKPRFWQWLWSRRDPELVDGPARELIVVGAELSEGLYESQKFNVRFKSAQQFEVSADQKTLGEGTLGIPLTTSLATFTLKRGTSGAPQAGATFDLEIAPTDAVVGDAIERMTVTAPKVGTGGGDLVKVVTLEFEYGSPRKAAEFLRRVMEAYLGRRQAWKTEDATAAESFVGDQLRGMRDSLDNTQQKLADYRSNNRVVVLDNEAKAMIEQLGKYEEQRVAARMQVAALSDIKRALRDPNPPVEAFLLGEASDSVLEGLGRALADSRRQLTELEGRFHEAAPDVKNQKAQIAAQLETIRNYVTSRLSRAQDSLSTLNGIINQFEAKLKTVPGAELGLAQLSRESDVYSKLYSYLLERQQQAAIVKASTVSKNRILDLPEIPHKESSPRLGMRLASGVLGVLLGVLLVFLKRFFSTTLQSEANVRTLFRETAILAKIPQGARRPDKRAILAPAFQSMAADENSSYTEAFRTARTSLYQFGREGIPRVLLVTSPTPGDGKTTSTLALAAMLAADGKWVLVIDADLRKPSHHLLAGHHEVEGLRGVLSGRVSWRDAVRAVPVSFGEFFSLGAGRMGPAELLSNERMSRLLIEARAHYDFVLIDAPSFPLVADPLALAPLADVVLSVVRLGHTPRGLATEHVKRIAQASHGHALIVNGAPAAPVYGYGRPPRSKLSSIARLKPAKRSFVEEES